MELTMALLPSSSSLLPRNPKNGSSSKVSAAMKPSASPRSPHPRNVSGDVFVDHTCIDCDTCRWMAPKFFTRMEGQSVVYRQPASPDERAQALQALLSCPTASIHTVKPPSDINQVHDMFPLPIDESIPGVYHNGYHSKKSAGAASYFIVRPEGNILIDSPNFTPKLVKKLEAMGGIRYMFLTHKDDIADHKLWHERFGCERILHKLEIQEDTKDVEIQLEGSGPWDFLGKDIDLVLVEGHTEGSVCLFYKPKKVLFTGDHLFAEADERLHFSHVYNFYSVAKQVDSMACLLPLDFVWILPGHGRRKSFRSLEEKNAAIEDLINREQIALKSVSNVET